MLTISPEQFEVFQPVAEAAFVRRVVEHLRADHANVVLRLPNEVALLKQTSDERLREMVKNAVARARGYGLDWEASVTAFVVLMFVAAPNFDEHPLIHRVLKDGRVDANSRVDQLWERTSEENWDAVAKNYDPTAWGSEGGRR
jgi:hypothetical protein